MFNVVFLSSGVTRACLNAVGKMPVRRDVLIMCVSAGKSVGEIAWRRCEGIGITFLKYYSCFKAKMLNYSMFDSN